MMPQLLFSIIKEASNKFYDWDIIDLAMIAYLQLKPHDYCTILLFKGNIIIVWLESFKL